MLHPQFTILILLHMYEWLVFLCTCCLKRTHQTQNGRYRRKVEFGDNGCGLYQRFHFMELRFIYSNTLAIVLIRQSTSHIKPELKVSASPYNSLNAVAVLLNR